MKIEHIELLRDCAPELVTYINEQVLPRYATFDKAHRLDHAWQVIEGSLELAHSLGLDCNMALTIAAYHDVGLVDGRERHHVRSAELLLDDPSLRRWFTDAQLAIMAQAIEDHRASNTWEPRTIYGKVVAEADRVIESELTLKRTIQYGLKQMPNASEQEQYERMKKHLQEKYGRQGYLKLWLNLPKNIQGLEEIRTLLDDEKLLYAHFLAIYNQEKHTEVPK